ncbi:MAG: prolyl oligopeptidase family serine peptidase [Oligoflexia bacterium]|nr:prolyl oligopeptidase family serine peptidase [Oligoflexia bacterium]
MKSEIQEIIDRETRAWDESSVDHLLSIFHPDMVWVWPPDASSYDPSTWVSPLGKFNRERWAKSYNEWFQKFELVRNVRTTQKIVMTEQGDGAFAIVDIDTLWRTSSGEESHWSGRTCKTYAKTSSGWKMIFQVGALKALLVLALFIAVTSFEVCAHAAPWQPAGGREQVPLWPASPPNFKSAPGPEELAKAANLVAGQPWHEITNVARPTFTVFSPKDSNTGAAVIVFPGGGYRGLAIDLEGTEVCDWLTSNGVACVLLKYRVPGSGPHWNPILHKRIKPKTHTALQDAQRALSLIRHRASDYGINPSKIGVLGFSAGGHLVAAISTNQKRIYSPVDDADKGSVRPDFAIALYPGHMSVNYKDDLSKLNPTIRVTKQTPPTLLIHAQDDPVDPVEYSLLYYAALRKEKVPVEMHLFAEGKHAFGLRRTDLPITKWPKIAETWLRTIKMIGDRDSSVSQK